MLGQATGWTGVAITEDEAGKLAEASQRVLRWYDVPEISEKVMDHVNLGMVLISVYGTRLGAAVISREAARAAPAAPVENPPAPVMQTEPPALPSVPTTLANPDSASRPFGGG